MNTEVAVISLLGVICLVLLVSIIGNHLVKIKALKKQAAELQVPEPEPLLVPEQLGIRNLSNLAGEVKKLESAIAADYFAHVKERLLQKGLLAEHEYDLYLMEMKRYFILTNFMESVPMYNEKVDHIWHEMILFTKSYQRFCNAFSDRMIHHEPNLHPEPNPFERELFEFTYLNLFEPHEHTEEMFPQLQKTHFSEEFLAEIDSKTPLAFINKHYSPLGETEKGLLYNLLVQSKNEWSRHRMNTTESKLTKIPAKAEFGHTGSYKEPKTFIAESLLFQTVATEETEKNKKADDNSSYTPVTSSWDDSLSKSSPSKSSSISDSYDSGGSSYSSCSSSSSSGSSSGSGSSSSCGSSCSS